MLSNLLGNAIKFTKAGTVTITTEKSRDLPQEVVVAVVLALPQCDCHWT